METKYGFTKMTIEEFETWLEQTRIARTILTVQEHHTYSPSYALFKGNNHFELQKGMKNHHVNHNGWSDIGQHFTTFPDGTIVTGRSLERSPACILGQNANAICFEHLGNFDKGKDGMTDAHKNTIVRVTAAFCKKFNLPVNTKSIVYHHWFDLGTGKRNDGTKNNKSCPGTGFFGGNKVPDAEANFIPLVAKAMGKGTLISSVPLTPIKYVSVEANSLNIRIGPDISFDKASDRDPVSMGSVLRVYEEKDEWYRISSSAQHWVSGKYTKDVKRGTVTAGTLNARSGPGTEYPRIGSFTRGTELFISDEAGTWGKVSMDGKWVSMNYLDFS